MKYGYVAQGPDGAPSNPADIPRALKTLQKFAGIEETGILDDATVELLGKERCGVEDIIGSAKMQAKLRRGSEPGFSRYSTAQRERRYNIDGAKWSTTNLNYYYENYAEDISQSDMRDVISRAWRVWSDVTPLTFTEVEAKPQAHIVIKFARGNHGDGEYAAFDGPGGTLAHAYFPENGDAHFDEDEEFTVASPDGTNLFIVAAHEFGHSLGLAHSSEQGALMYPWYQGYVPDFQLPRDDILGIQQLYGKPDVARPGTPMDDGFGPRIKPGRPNTCTSDWDAVTMGGDGLTYAFKGRYLWAINDVGVVRGYPKKIGLVYRGAPSNIHAAVTTFAYSQPRTYIFKGHRMWRFTNFVLDPGYPKKTAPRGVPQSPNAAFVWGGNGQMYIFKGARYYEFNPEREKIVGSPLKIATKWPGVPVMIDGALQWRNGRTYFFKGDSYWRFNDAKLKVGRDFPRSKALYWMGCGLEEGQVLPERLQMSEGK
ncbi:matrix metalloproteinase-2-like [Acanthaster planci]|uniref:Matrix metalloproteinase-2-like n=1 Tax=Acanthaster planci TaxID=133434 RepID=A0A8B7ZFS4_ACAPL|nr:matrix metalloproteinase-2-like [Acanthaster planci]